MKMRQIIKLLNDANKAYYYENREIMSNKEYDDLYDKLVQMEEKTGIIYSDSPTQNLGEHLYSSLPKEKHESPMLSLDKTKERLVLQSKLSNQQGVLSWKLDGLTVVLTYENGKLTKAVTRGNGEIGEVVTENAKRFVGVPLEIPYKRKVVLRGEAVISYESFNEINVEGKYKNPRNLASASVRLLNSPDVCKRKVEYIVFQVLEPTRLKSVTDRFKWISNLGFNVVEHVIVDSTNILSTIQLFSNRIDKNPIPTDGLVLTFNDIKYGESLGRTGKFPRHSMAFKWKDEVAETVLREVIWQTSRTGIINPVAVFDTVELEGTEVNRATLNNVSFIKQLQLGIGDTIECYKANMIIPQVLRSITKGNNVVIPDKCPTCGGDTKVFKENESEILYCMNESCPAKLINQLAHYASRDAMNIDGLSSKRIEFLVEQGWVNCIADLYDLDSYRIKWSNMKGWTTKSIDKLLNAIETSKKTTPERFIYALGIPKIGRSQAKELVKEFKTWDAFIDACEKKYNFARLDGFGEQLNTNIYAWYGKYYKEIKPVAEWMEFETAQTTVATVSAIKGKTFVITGSLVKFKNRKELTETIESLGGKVAGSVSSKTDYLINNDNLSSSSKNQKAKQLGVKIITEAELLAVL